MVMVMTHPVFRFSRPLCDLPRPHVRMLLYIQPKPSSSISHASDASSGFKHPTVEELPTECTMARTMAQSIAGPGQYCTKNVKCHPRSVSYPSRKSSASIRAPARLPSQPRLIQFWLLGSRGARPRSTVAKLFFELQTEAPLLKNCHPISPSRRITEQPR